MAVFRIKFKCKKTGKAKLSACYYGKVADAAGKLKRTKLTPAKRESEDLLAKLKHEARVARDAAKNPLEAARRRTLNEHVDDFRRYLDSKRRTNGHVDNTIARLVKLLDGSGFRMLGDIAPQPVRDWLKDRLDAGEIDGFDRMGNTRMRPFGLGAANHYLTAAKAFTRWAYNEHRLPRNPLAGISKFNEEEDRRRCRRAMMAEELEWLIATTDDFGEPRKGLSGRERGLIYLLSAYTGLRAAEIASLSAASFDLNDEAPTVTVEAGKSKRRTRDVLPLVQDAAMRVRKYLGKRDLLPIERQTRLWPGRWFRRGAEMLRDDMQLARRAWLNESIGDQRDAREKSDFLLPEDADGLVLDFHALRHTFCTNLAATNATTKMMMELARHSTPSLTLGRYSHVRLADAHTAVNALPTLGDPRQRDAAKATGTDGRRAEFTGPKLDQTTAEIGPTAVRHRTTTGPRGGHESPRLATPPKAENGENAEENGPACPTVATPVNSRGGDRTRTSHYGTQDFKECVPTGDNLGQVQTGQSFTAYGDFRHWTTDWTTPVSTSVPSADGHGAACFAAAVERSSIRPDESPSVDGDASAAMAAQAAVCRVPHVGGRMADQRPSDAFCGQPRGLALDPLADLPDVARLAVSVLRALPSSDRRRVALDLCPDLDCKTTAVGSADPRKPR